MPVPRIPPSLLTPALQECVPRGHDVAYECFYADERPGLWVRLLSLLPELEEAGVRILLLPPLSKGLSGERSFGYDAHDHYDTGCLMQHGTVATRWGTEQELTALVAAARERDLHVVCDLVATKYYPAAAPPQSKAFKHPEDTLQAIPGQPAARHLLLQHPHNELHMQCLLNTYMTQLGVTGVRWCASDLVPPRLATACTDKLRMLRLQIAWPRWDLPRASAPSSSPDADAYANTDDVLTPEEAAQNPTYKVPQETERYSDRGSAQQWQRCVPGSLLMDFRFWELLAAALLRPCGAAWHGLLSHEAARSVLFVKSYAVHHHPFCAASFGLPELLLGYSYILACGQGVPLLSSDDVCRPAVRALVTRLSRLCRAAPARASPAFSDATVLALLRPTFLVVLNAGAEPRALDVQVGATAVDRCCTYSADGAAEVDVAAAGASLGRRHGLVHVEVPAKAVSLWWQGGA